MKRSHTDTSEPRSTLPGIKDPPRGMGLATEPEAQNPGIQSEQQRKTRGEGRVKLTGLWRILTGPMPV